MMWIPAGFAHGFLVLSDRADCAYKASAYYSPQHERTILWNDQKLGIEWPRKEKPIVSAKDGAGSLFSDADVFE